jgi:adenylate cyclase
MVQISRSSIQIDLNEFKLHLHLKGRTQLTLHFNSPSRKFYLSVIALIVNEMKKRGKIKSIPLQEHVDLLVMLNESIGESAGASDKDNLLHRIYRKWKDALPNLEEAPLFMVLGKKKELGDGANGKIYSFADAEKDDWANLFDYMGSEQNVRLKFAIDKIGANLNDVVIVYEDSSNAEAWEKFISSLRNSKKEETQPVEELAEPPIPELSVVPVLPPQQRKSFWLSHYRWVAVAAIVVIATTLGIWKIYLRPDHGDVASIKKMAFPLPEEPSIAVLPFVNMSADPKQEFLCDGITDGIIIALTKVPRLFVIARTSTFTYKGNPVMVKQVSEELGVRYVLEGVFQKSGDRIRITAQLIDALTGNHLWAERYDRDLKDIFALQDEIILKILTGVRVKLNGGDVAKAERFAEKYYKGRQGLDCYLKLMEGWGYWVRFNIDDNNLARRMTEEAIAVCPESPWAYIQLGWVHYLDYLLNNTKSPRETIERGIELAQKALAKDDSMAAEAHGLLSRLYSCKGEHEKALAEGQRAVALDPNGWGVLINYGNSLLFAGKPEEAIPFFQKVIRLTPHGPAFVYFSLGHALQMTGRFEEAVSAYKKALKITPENISFHISLAYTYSMMGRAKEARAEAAEVLRINPKFSLDSFSKARPYKDQSEVDKLANALRKAGLK